MNAAPIEAKKDGLAQLQDGCWKLTLKVHLDDMPTWLMKASMGTRLACAIVEIGDDEQPVPHEISPAKKAYQSKTEGEKAVTRAVMLCQDETFINWIWHPDWRGEATGMDEENARDWLCEECKISSRAELASNPHALQSFFDIERQYRQAIGQATEPRG